MPIPKFNSRLLFALIAIAAIALAMVVESKVPIGECHAVSPDKQLVFTTRLYRHSTLLGSRYSTESTIRQNDSGQTLFSQVDRLQFQEETFNQQSVTALYDAVPRWSNDSMEVTFPSPVDCDSILTIIQTKSGYQFSVSHRGPGSHHGQM